MFFINKIINESFRKCKISVVNIIMHLGDIVSHLPEKKRNPKVQINI